MKPAIGPMPADQPKFGLGKTTPREMAYLMEAIGLCHLHQQGTAATPGAARFLPTDAADRAVCAVALNMLKNQFYRETIPRYLETVDTSETGTAIASKTGSLDEVRNDVAIVQGKSGPLLLSIFTYDNKRPRLDRRQRSRSLHRQTRQGHRRCLVPHRLRRQEPRPRPGPPRRRDHPLPTQPPK